jgi:thiamine-phosphate pyrophosphorylase
VNDQRIDNGSPNCSVTAGARSIAGLYAIADSSACGNDALPEYVRQLLKGGCRLIQLRMKDPASARKRRAVATEIMALKRCWPFTFIINDDVDVALEVGADGVHVGKNDETIDAIRRRAGNRLLIGSSAHSLREAEGAERAGADYVAFGAIFPSPTKGPGHPVQGIAKLAELTRNVCVPVVAIGGIGRANVREVLARGASAVAMISALARAPDVTAEARWFTQALEGLPRIER